MRPWSAFPTEETTEQAGSPHEQLIERVAQRLVELRMGAPALFMLEATRPLSFVASQAMIVFEPIVGAIFNVAEYRQFQQMMEDRANIDRLMNRIEELEDRRAARVTQASPKRRQP